MMTHEEWKRDQETSGMCACHGCWSRYAEYYGAKSLVAPRPTRPPFRLFVKQYEGFESSSDMFRDIREAFDKRFNPEAAKLPGEFQGTMRVTITYIPSEDDPV
jgi:hypothetical protein